LRSQGSIRTSTYFSTAPFAGAAISLLVFRQVPDMLFLAALLLMLAGVFLLEREIYAHLHRHVRIVHEHHHQRDDRHQPNPHERFPEDGESTP
jgi:hypothetical protein